MIQRLRFPIAFNLNAISLALALLSHPVLAISEEEYLLEDNNDFSFDNSQIDTIEPHWSDDFKFTLEHRSTRDRDSVRYQRSIARVEYETAVSDNWFVRLDTRKQRFWGTDQLSASNGAYTINKWQSIWAQYSHGNCALKLGRQTLIWGQVEGVFVTDVITPFDFSEQLLTDYQDIRLPQDMLVTDCFFAKNKIQLFYTPESKVNTYYHRESRPTTSSKPETGNDEWGLKYKITRTGYELILMYANLNTNSTHFNETLLKARPKPLPFEMYGAGASIALNKVLLKFDAAYKTQQPTGPTSQTRDLLELAIGFDYTSGSNRSVNFGLLSRYFYDYDKGQDSIDGITLGWSERFMNENLSVSLLSYWLAEPRTSNTTILSEYQWDDYLSFSFAIGDASLSRDAEQVPNLENGPFSTFGVKYEF